MSFSAAVKQELAALPLEKPCCMAAEFNALTACCASLSLQGGGRAQVQYRTLSASVLKRIFTLLRRRYNLRGLPRQSSLSRFGGQKQYALQLSVQDSRTLLQKLFPGKSAQDLGAFRGVPKRVARRICCRRAWVRGAFLGCGSLSDPEVGYRAEFVFQDASRAAYLLRLLALCDVQASLTHRRGAQVVYVRQGDALVTLMGLMGAARAVLDIENIRASGSLNAAINRITNCDSANVSKQLSAAQWQVAQITLISLAQGLNTLPQELEQLARLRLSNPDANLAQLGELLDPPLSKSGVQHRMERILRCAQGI